MHLGKCHSAIHDLYVEYVSTEINSRIQNLINHLDSLSNNPGNLEIAHTFKQLLLELKDNGLSGL